MTFTLSSSDLLDLSVGAAVLGTGGGGDPHIGRLMARRAIGSGHVRVLGLDDVDDDWFVVPCAQMGAPSIGAEKLPNGAEPVQALRTLETYVGRTADAVVAVECGGINSMIPLVVAAQTGLPVVDADGMGRAFPELQMKTFAAYGVSGSPMAMAGEFGETSIIDTGGDNARMEWLARGVTMRMGGVAHISEFSMDGRDLKRTAIPGTLTLGLTIGRAVRRARTEHRPVSEALAEVVAESGYAGVRSLFNGKIVDVERTVDAGFTKGRARFRAFESAAELVVDFQNEFLTARLDGELVCVVPDLICVLDSETGEAITTDRLRYGQRVQVLGIGTPPVMRTEAALAAFGPAAFGLDTPFVPVEQLA